MRTFITLALAAVAIAQPELNEELDVVEIQPVDPATELDGTHWGRSDENLEWHDETDVSVSGVNDVIGEVTTETTDFYMNADEMAARAAEDMDWNNSLAFDNINFGELFEIVRGDLSVQDAADWTRDQYMTYYRSYAESLPEVCEDGKKCRTEIREEVRRSVFLEWERAIASIQAELAATITVSRAKFQRSYEDAFFCDHGCQCKFIEKQYTELTTGIEAKLKLIAGLEEEIDIWEGEIEAWESTDCDFTVLRLEAEAEWASRLEEHNAMMDALDNWKTDGHEMDDLVDQEAFEKEYGFRYDSHRWDDWYNGHMN